MLSLQDTAHSTHQATSTHDVPLHLQPLTWLFPFLCTASVTCCRQPRLQALKLGALSANIVSEEPIDVVMHESHEGHADLWNQHKQVRFGPLLVLRRVVSHHLCVLQV